MQGADRERFNEIKKELSKLSTKFSNNVLDATKAFKKLITEKALVERPSRVCFGTGCSAGQGSRDMRRQLQRTDPWLITLDFPVLLPSDEHMPRTGDLIEVDSFRDSILLI